MEVILQKATGLMVVGGVASNFFRDLDGDAIDPQAIQRAIPGFMAGRGPDGLQGGPIRLHHGFWERFLQRAINALSLPYDEQVKLLGAIALPLGRVTEISVDSDGTTRWRGVLSAANPIAQTVYSMLKEGLVSLGVSVGGKINAVRPGRDAIGRQCQLITDVRLDELSITDNPANRLIESEAPDNGAYISALAKSLGVSRRNTMTSNFLAKALGATTREFGSGSWRDTSIPAMGKRMDSSSSRPKGAKKVQMDHTQPTTGMGGKQPKAQRTYSSGGMPPTDVFGITITQLTRDLAKCAAMGVDGWSAPETVTYLTDSARAIAGMTEHPTAEMANFVRFLQTLTRFAQELPFMSDYQAAGTVKAMGDDLTKSLHEFVEKMPEELKGKPMRPPGSPGVVGIDIQFPRQYITYS